MEHNCTNSTSINMSLPDFLDSLQQQTTLVMIPSLCFLAMLGVTGLVGNTLILVVYSRRFKSNPTNVLLMTIAVFDLVANIGALPVEVLTVIWTWNFHDVVLCKTKVFLNSFTTIGSMIALVAVAVVRYRKICAPHGWQVSSQQVKLFSLVAVIIGVLLSIPGFILYGPRSKPTPCDKIQGHECYVSDMYRESFLVKVNNGIYFMLYVFTSAPLTVMYILIGIQAHRRTTNVKGPKQDNEKKTASTSMAVSHENLTELQSLKLKPSTATIDSGKGSFSNSGVESAELSSCSIPASSFSQNCLHERQLDDDHLPYYSDFSKNKMDDLQQTRHNAKSHIANNKNKFIKKTTSSAKIKSNKISSSVQSLNLDDVPAQYSLSEISNRNSHPETHNKLKRTQKHHKITILINGKERNLKTNGTKSKKHKRGSSNRVTSMLITITFIYVISYLIFLLLSLFRNFLPRHYESMNSLQMAVFHLFFRMYFLNCAANCIIYGLCDPNFRRECLRVIRCGSRSQKS